MRGRLKRNSFANWLFRFIAGPLCHLKMKYDTHETNGWRWMGFVWLDSFLILFGMGIGGWTIYLAILDLISGSS